MGNGVSSALMLNGDIDHDCKKLTNKIKGALYDIAHSFVYIGLLLSELQYSEDYLLWGYDSVYDYAFKELGFKKSSVNNFINVCRVFSTDGHSMFLKDKFEDFNYSQLCEMLSMSEKQRELIDFSMSVRQIRNIKKQANSVVDVFDVSPSEIVESSASNFQTSGKFDFLPCGDVVDLINELDESYLTQENYVNFGIFCSDYFEANGYQIIKLNESACDVK